MIAQRKRVLVTGAGGYVGFALTRALVSAEVFEITALVRHRAAVEGVRTVAVDLTDQRTLTALLRDLRPDAILHAAGRVHGPAAELFRENSAATAVLADAVLAACPDAIVTALGSAAEYGRPSPGERLREDAPLRPLGVYGHAKVAAACYLLAAAERGLRQNLVRIFNLVGLTNSPDQVLGAFISKLLRARSEVAPRSVRTGPLGSIRDFIVMDDVATLIVRLLNEGESGHLVNACSGEGRQVRDLVHHILRRSKMAVEVVEAEATSSPGGAPDIVVGDPTHFLRLSRLAAFSSVENTLDAAWFKAARST